VYKHKSGETPLDDLSGLKLKIPHITRAQIDEAEAKNIQGAALKYMNPKRIRTFDCKFASNLHKAMFSQVWEWAGVYRTTQTNLGSRPSQIHQDLLILFDDLKHKENVLDTGIWLHHRAVQVHPFPNGNGRWARMLSDLWLDKYVGLTIHWPETMENESPIRRRYIEALKAADGLDYSLLRSVYDELVKAA